MDKKRLGRIEQEIKKEISTLMHYDLSDPLISKMASISKVEVTGDLQYAKVFITVLGNEKDRDDTIEGLDRAKGFIKKELGNRLKLRNIPRLTFLPDVSIERGVYMNKLIEDVIAMDNANRVEEIEEDKDENID